MAEAGDLLQFPFADLHPEKTRVIALPKRIWVFGGPCEDGGSESFPASLRDSFWSQTLNFFPSRPWFADLDRPENHRDWWEYSGYSDLLEFERDAAYLARAVLIFAESPGSYAELGAFALDPILLERLHVVVSSRYLHQEKRNSFLMLGPIKRAKEAGGRCVIGGDADRQLVEDDFHTVIDSIDDWLPKVPKKSAFDPSNPTHRLLLISDLADLLLVAKYSELIKITAQFRIELSEAQIERAVKLLDFFGLVKLEERGSEPFVCRSIHTKSPWLDYVGTHAAPFDRMRFKIQREQVVISDRRKASILRRRP